MSDLTTTPVYELRNVSRTYTLGGVHVHAVRGLDLTLEAGESVAIQGPSGSGKTTLLQLLGALDRPTGGELLFEGRDIGRLGDRVLSELRLEELGFVFQQFNLIPTLTAAQNVEMALAPTSSPRAERRERVLALLSSVGLAERAEHVPSKLSGGEQQRVAIARALANDPHVLLADEPTGNLDSTTGAEIVDLLLSLSGNDRRRTVIVVTHDADVARRAQRVIRMQDGRRVPTGDPVGVGVARMRHESHPADESREGGRRQTLPMALLVGNAARVETVAAVGARALPWGWYYRSSGAPPHRSAT